MTDNRTLSYYDTNAEAFFAETVDVYMSPLYGRFLDRIPAGGPIVDAGCGFGRDAKAFMERRYQVTAFDASLTLAQKASGLLGIKVQCRIFDDVTEVDTFDAVWACASLLHLPRSELSAAIGKLAHALRADGVLYASFKAGTGERIDTAGRHFTDMTSASLHSLLDHHAYLGVIDVWQTTDRRSDRPGQSWWNVLAYRM